MEPPSTRGDIRRYPEITADQADHGEPADEVAVSGSLVIEDRGLAEHRMETKPAKISKRSGVQIEDHWPPYADTTSR